jgi:hypothetical protein
LRRTAAGDPEDIRKGENSYISGFIGHSDKVPREGETGAIEAETGTVVYEIHQR